MAATITLVCDYPPCSTPFTLALHHYTRRQKFCPRSYCSTTCSAKDRSRHYPRPTLAERFWSHVNVAGLDDCWEWQGWKRAGYGKMYVLERDTDVTATHIAWFLAYGGWPTLDVLHTCDNPPCVNIAHLFQGTPVDNSQDMVRKGRHSSVTHPESLARGDRNGSRRHPERLARGDRNGTRLHPERLRRGEANNKTKLSDAQRSELLHLYHNEGWTLSRLAQRYGVTRQAIRHRVKTDNYP